MTMFFNERVWAIKKRDDGQLLSCSEFIGMRSDQDPVPVTFIDGVVAKRYAKEYGEAIEVRATIKEVT